MAGLEFRVLGRVQALRGGEEVAVGRSGALNLLAGLLVRANSVVSGDALAELAWGQAGPVNPRAALHSKISRLRRLLGESVIETIGEGYRLRAGVCQLDLLWFDSLVSRAAAAADDEQAAAALTEAISLWHGDPLVNTDSLTLASEAAPQLTERYLLACEQWAEVSLRLGRPAEVVQRITPLAHAHPFREPIVRLLMLAFCHDGRQAEALTVYDGLRRRLSEELGADPSPALREVHTAILRGTLVQSGPALVESRQHRWPGPGHVPAGPASQEPDPTVLVQPERRGPAITAAEPAGVPAEAGASGGGPPQVAERSAALARDGSQYTELHIGTLSEVRVALDPYISVLALTTDALGRRRGAPEAWRRRILSSLSPSGARAILPITAPRHSVTPESVTPLSPAREEPVHTQVEWLHAMSEDDLLGDIHQVFGQTPPPQWQGALRRPRNWVHDYADAMADAWRAVEPMWIKSKPILEREVRRVGAAAVRGGLDLILDRLHPASRLDNHVLRIPDPEPATIDLGDRPLVLVPMLSGVRALICNLERSDAVWIAYPIPRMDTAAAHKIGWPVRSDLLGSVMGPVHARILLALERPHTISQLGRLSRLAPSALAHHCERLAAAGLVQHEKLWNEVWISRTSRGMGMVALFAEPP